MEDFDHNDNEEKKDPKEDCANGHQSSEEDDSISHEIPFYLNGDQWVWIWADTCQEFEELLIQDQIGSEYTDLDARAKH